jgi:cobalt-zinc-cadmium efflux system outer membrane protein
MKVPLAILPVPLILALLPVANGQERSQYDQASELPQEQAAEVVSLPPIETSVMPTQLADFEALALANNPTLVQASARAQAARGRRLQAGLYPNPEVGYLASEIGDSDEAGQQGGFVAQQFVTGQKLALSQQVASQEIRQAQQQFEAQRLRVLNDTRREFYSVLVAQESLRVTEELVQIGDRAVNASNQLLEAQETGRVDLLQANVELQTARIALVNANNRYLAAWRRLAAVTGVPAMAPARVEGDLHATIPEVSWDEALGDILSGSPELSAARTGIARARMVLRRAWAEPIPNIDVQTSVQYDNASGDTITGVQIGLPLPVFNRNQGNIREAYADLVAASAEVSRTELELQERLAAVFERYATARNQVFTYSRDILPSAKQSLDLVALGYQSGEFTFLTLLTAQRTYSQANLAYLNALNEMWASAIEIDGLLLVNSLQEPTAN